MTIRTGAESRAAKGRGRQTENLAVEYLESRGLKVERRRLTGIEDCGDLSGWAGMVVEVKHGGLRDIPEALKELPIQIQSADNRFPRDAPHRGIVVARRKGKPWAGDWYCCVRFEDMVDILLGKTTP